MKRLCLLLTLLACTVGGLPSPATAADGDVFADWSISSASVHTSGQVAYGESVDVWWETTGSGPDAPTVTATVTNRSNGRVVRTKEFGRDTYDGWSWYGGDDDGQIVSPGTYVVTLTGTGPDSTQGPTEVHSTSVKVVDAGVCYGIAGCIVRAHTDVNGDRVADVVAVASQGTRDERQAMVRVKTGPGRIVSVKRRVPRWYGPLWEGVARLDGRRGAEIVVGQLAGAHTEFYRALTWRAGRLATLDAPGAGAFWVVDGAVSVSIGWQHRAGEPAGTLWKRSAVRAGDPLRGHFKGTLTEVRWTDRGWHRVATRTYRRLPDRTAYSWGGFRIPGLARW
jgi:hypothetical protein